jgi:hypothetical protein
MAVDFRELCKLQIMEIDRQRAEITQLVAERNELRQHLENLAPGAPDAHACLKRIYNDPSMKESERNRAAAAAIGYEKSKPASVVNNVHTLFDTLERHHQAERIARENAAKTIEHQPRKPIDYNEPVPGTVLGEGCGHAGAWHPLDQDEKPEPAA